MRRPNANPVSTAWLSIVCAAVLACSHRQVPASPAAHTRGAAPAGVDPTSVERVPVEVARARVLAGQALFVCAYGDARCAQLRLEGSIPWSALQARLPQLPRDQEILLYCD